MDGGPTDGRWSGSACRRATSAPVVNVGLRHQHLRVHRRHRHRAQPLRLGGHPPSSTANPPPTIPGASLPPSPQNPESHPPRLGVIQRSARQPVGEARTWVRSFMVRHFPRCGGRVSLRTMAARRTTRRCNHRDSHPGAGRGERRGLDRKTNARIMHQSGMIAQASPRSAHSYPAHQ